MAVADKKSLTEADIRTKYITPAITEKAGWDVHTQLREEVHLTDGPLMVRGNEAKRGKGKRADYVLYHKPNLPLAVVEAKDNNHSIGDGMQQALGYAEMLGVPFAFSSNGDGFLFHDGTVTDGEVERELPLNEFPTPDELWQRYCQWKGIAEKELPIVTQDYHSDGSDKTPRYYQLNAINNTIEAIAKGQNRILLVMATGTGKTYTAFQIIWRLWKARQKKRILFLADRNILVDQTKTNDFKPFGQAMTKIKNRQVDKSFEVYLALYQGITGLEEDKKIYKQFSKDFFDLIVVDECHRGSAKQDSEWRDILEHYSSATQIGLTATPKETREISNIDYFGEPVYTYSLKQGIDDGFLAPYKVVRMDLDKDLGGWRPSEGDVDRDGNQIEDRVYNLKDYDKNIVLTERNKLVAKKITEFLKANTDRYAKSIIFCEDIAHAERMRQALVNENADLTADNRKYVMRITGDNQEGKDELDNFIHPEEKYPVLVTTSRLLSTGVDAQTCKLIVLDRTIGSMTEFKQIIGRGTRIKEECGKLFFTIMDFRRATELFADPDFDGDPVVILDPDGNEEDPQDPPGQPPEDPAGPGPIIDPEPPDGPRIRQIVDGIPFEVVGERVQHIGADGKLITESIRDYTRKQVSKEYSSLDTFLQHWTEADRKHLVVKELEEKGLFLESLQAEVGRDYDPFDLICHVAYDQPPLTRRERAENVRKRDYFTRHGDKARAVLEALLEKYSDEGLLELENLDVLKVQPFNEIGTPIQIVQSFGGRDQYLEAVRELEEQLYLAA